jgi:hypothetical protein
MSRRICMPWTRVGDNPQMPAEGVFTGAAGPYFLFMTRIATALITLAAAAAFALGLGTSTSLAAVPPVPWAAQVSGSNGNYGYSVSALPDGSSIVTGGFNGTATFGSTTLTSVGGDDVFVAKLNRSGSYVWATQAGGSAWEGGYGVSTLPDGSSIVTGYFEGTATFGSTTLTSAGFADIFVAKLSPSGSFEWATRAGTSGGQDFGYGVSALPDGSAILTGYFELGAATFGSTTLTTTRGDAFVAKVDPEGSFAWAKQIGSASGYVYGFSPSVLTDGSVIVTGAFEGTTAFGSISLTSAGNWDNFITKLDSSGSFVWANRAGGTSNDFGGMSVSALPDGSAIYTGRFQGTATFGSTTLTAVGSADMFVAKVDASGSFVWATQAGGSSFDTGYGVTALPDGSSIVTGYFYGTATFGSNTFTAAGNDDIFVAKVSPSGSFVWSMQAGASAGGRGFGATSLVDGSVFVTGNCFGTTTFGTNTLACPMTGDGFVAKFLDAPQAPAAPQAVAGDGQATVTITPLAGGSVTTYTVLAGPGGQTCTITAPATSCIVTGLTNGTRYTFTATATNATGTSPASAASNAVTPTGTTPQATTTTTTLRPTVLPSRTRITSGQSMRLGIRTTNTGSATASSVTSCITLPANLVVIRTGGATRSGRTLCFSLGDLPAGATRTNALTVRAVATRSVIRRVSATTRSTSASPAPTTARSAPIRISPRAARARVTG